jgi:MFS family permease
MTHNQPAAAHNPAKFGFGPLRQGVFRALWTATLVSNLGTWMQNVGASWLMTSLSPSPLVVSMVQAATSLPVFVLGLPAGALADIFPRRRLLLVSQWWMLAAAAGLSVATLSRAISPEVLLAFTFALGIGSAMNGPAFQAVVTDIVPASDLTAAVSLNSASFNLARAVGPALGGLIVAKAGAGATFLLNTFSFLAVIVVLYRWKPATSKPVLPAERFVGAMRAGVRYLAHSPGLRAVVLRTMSFTLFGSALWALLPLVVKTELRRGPSTYGMLLGALGVGALAGAAVLPQLHRRLSLNQVVAGGTIVFAGVSVATAILPPVQLLMAVMLMGGLGWMTLLSSLSIATREVVPAWVQGRALSLYLLVFQGGLAGGSVLWGAVAKHSGIRPALVSAALGLALAVLLGLRYSLPAVNTLNLSQASLSPEPVLMAGTNTGGPVLVTVLYRIPTEDAEEFVHRIAKLEVIRRRDGATQWGLFRDGSDADLYLEEFIVESWLEHLRQHERITVSDLEIQRAVLALHLGPDAPRVIHYVAAEPLNRSKELGRSDTCRHR